MSSGVSGSPSSLESRLLSPAVVAQLWGDGTGLGAWGGGAAWSRVLEEEVEEPPRTLEWRKREREG